MKTLDPDLAAHLSGGVTTLCWCWRLTRRDGVVMGFTDHDRDVAFDDTLFEAAAGFSASEIRDSVGLGVDNLEVESALSSNRLEELDIIAGRYDDAAVEIFRVNWQDPDQRVLLRSGTLGEVRRSGAAFTAEVRGLSHYLQQPRGRLYQFSCDANLGDSRCGIDLLSAVYRASGSVSAAMSDRCFLASSLSDYDADWFTRGLLSFTSGANAGIAFEVKRHAVEATAVVLELWQAPAKTIATGDAFTITAGCDKQLATCSARFANAVNFRGFPHMPGNDFVTAVARSGRARQVT